VILVATRVNRQVTSGEAVHKLASGAPRAAVVIVHGFGEHSARYEHVAVRLTAAGYAVHSMDNRGHGRSAGRRAYVDTFEDYLADLDGLMEVVRARSGGLPVYLLGHSFGGAIATRYALDHQDALAGLVLSGPLVSLGHVSPLAVAAGRLLSRLAPRTQVTRVDPAAVSRDPAVVADYAADPLNHHAGMPARTAAELLRATREIAAGVASLQLPLLVFHGGEDRLVSPAAGRWISEHAGSADRTLRVYDGLYHETLNEPEREAVLADLVAWLDARTPRT